MDERELVLCSGMWDDSQVESGTRAVPDAWKERNPDRPPAPHVPLRDVPLRQLYRQRRIERLLEYQRRRQ